MSAAAGRDDSVSRARDAPAPASEPEDFPRGFLSIPGHRQRCHSVHRWASQTSTDQIGTVKERRAIRRKA